MTPTPLARTLARMFIRTSLLTLVVLFTINPVHAGYISITTGISECRMPDENCLVNLSIVNRGNEAAYDSRIVLQLPEGFTAKKSTIAMGKLNVNRTMKGEAILERTQEKLPGLYPGIIIVEYKDANLRPFSAVVAFNIVLETLTSSPIKGVIDEVTLAGEKMETLKVRLKNSDDREYKITAALYIPRELSAKEIKKELDIPALGEGRVEFEISSFSALPGSTYPIFVAVTHEDGGQAYSTFVNGVVRVEKESPLFSTKNMVAILVILLIVFALYQVRGWR
jgi:hypothetical protein